jgi:hypothetical protein
VAGFTFLDWLQLFLPCVRWLRTYRVKEFLLVSVSFLCYTVLYVIVVALMFLVGSCAPVL